MIKFQWPFSRKAEPVGVEKKGAGMYLAGGSFLADAIGYGSGLYGLNRLTAQTAMSLYRESDAVSTAVDMIADEIEHIMPVIRMQDGKLDDSHEILSRLAMPNEFEGWPQFIGKLARHYLLTHDAFIFSGGTVTRPPISVHAIKPQCVTALEAADYYAASYQVASGYGSGVYDRKLVRGYARYYDGGLKELYHCRGFSSLTDETCADSPLLSAFKSVSQQIQGLIHNVKLLENGARPSMLVIFKDDLTVDEARKRKSYLQEQIGGASNSGEIMTAFAKDMEVREMSINNKDMDYKALNEVATTAIYNRYKIPLPLVSMDASTFNNMESAVYHLYDRAVLPLADKLLVALSNMLLPRYGVDPSKMWLTYNPENITALRGRMLEELKVRKALNVETINEIRGGLPNREPLEGGDVLYQAANLVPVGQDLFTDDNATTPEEQARTLAERDTAE